MQRIHIEIGKSSSYKKYKKTWDCWADSQVESIGLSCVVVDPYRTETTLQFPLIQPKANWCWDVLGPGGTGILNP